MKFIIAVDCEGVSCVTGTKNCSLSGSKDYNFAVKQATFETNSCIKALFDSGAKEVYVWDCHGEGQNLLYEKLDSRCFIICGQGFKSRFPNIDSSFSGVLMIGYHAMEGTKNAVLSHTYSSKTYKSIKVNNLICGEIFLDASVAGEYEVPLIFLSGDEQTCFEAEKLLPWIETVVTKKGFGRNCAICKHPENVKNEIYSKTLKAVKNIEKMKPLKFESPVEIEIEFKTVSKTIKALLKKRKGWKPKGLKKISKTFENMKSWNC